MLLARAIQIFMPGKPQVWYLDLFAGKNDHAAVERAGEGGHKEINRTNLSLDEARDRLKRDIVSKQLSLLRFRNNFPAFGFDASLTVLETDAKALSLRWKRAGWTAKLDANLSDSSFTIVATDETGKVVYELRQSAS